MALEFHETFTLEIPNVEGRFSEFELADFQEGHGLITEINAIHAGITANYNAYPSDALEGTLTSWTQPYPKPIILNHDLSTEPIGRVIGAKMAKEGDGTPYIKLQAAILDPAAMQKVKDKRYLTGSVGGRADEAVCSICSTNWAAPREAAGPACRHARGKIYSGKLAVIEMRGITWKEYSFVNAPADSRSIVSAVAESENEWSNSVRFFVLDTKKESIVECTESEDVDVLGEMKKKEATSLYMSLKGAFISAHADFSEMEEKAAANKFEVQIGAESIDSDTNGIDKDDYIPEEIGMARKAHEAQEENEDILALTQELSEDLSKLSTEANEEMPNHPYVDGDGDGTCDVCSQPESEHPSAKEAVGDGDDSGDADDSPETTDVKNHDFIDKNGDGNCDLCGATAAQHADASLNPAGKTTEAMTDGDDTGDADLSPEDNAPKNHDFIDKNGDGNCDLCGATAAQHADASLSPAGKENEERPEGQEKGTEDVDSETSDGAPKSREDEESEGANEGEAEVQADEAKLNDSETAESLVEELTAKLDTLEQENVKLKKALHRVLAERVVDAKIVVGAVEVEDRNAAVEEHAQRTASSLADALRDFAKLPKVTKTPDLSNLLMEENTQVVGDEKDAITIGEEEDSEPVNPEAVAEKTFVDALMGRIRL